MAQHACIDWRRLWFVCWAAPWERTNTSLRSSNNTFPCSTGYCCCISCFLAGTAAFGCSSQKREMSFYDRETQSDDVRREALIMITFQHARIRITPALTAVFATAHDRHVLCCLAKLLNVVLGNADPLPQPARGRACLLVFVQGGFGLRSAAERPILCILGMRHSESVSLSPVTSSLACLMTQHLPPSLPRCLSSLAGAVRLLHDSFQPAALGDLPRCPCRPWQAGRRDSRMAVARFSCYRLSTMASPATSVQRLTLLPLPCWSISLGRLLRRFSLPGSLQRAHLELACFVCFAASPASCAVAARRCSLSLPPSR